MSQPKIDFGWGILYVKTSRDLPGRNDPCPCGSGVKFKKCDHPVPEHLQVTEEELEADEKAEEARRQAYWAEAKKTQNRPLNEWRYLPYFLAP